MLKMPSILYFTQGPQATPEEEREAAQYGPGTVFRNASRVPDNISAGQIEDCDGVCGAVPLAYQDKPSADDALRRWGEANKKRIDDRQRRASDPNAQQVEVMPDVGVRLYSGGHSTLTGVERTNTIKRPDGATRINNDGTIEARHDGPFASTHRGQAMQRGEMQRQTDRAQGGDDTQAANRINPADDTRGAAATGDNDGSGALRPVQTGLQGDGAGGARSDTGAPATGWQSEAEKQAPKRGGNR